MKGFLSSFFFGIIAFSISAQQTDPYSHKVFDPDLKTVQLYAFGNGTLHPGLSSNVLNLNANDKMVLEFDDLRASYRQFHVKLQHCNLDWTASRLSELEYLKDYNDFIINDYEVSQNTKIPYFHYAFVLPELRISGNYVLLLYENYISDEPIASLKFRALDSRLGISANVQTAQDPALWKTHQQVNFEVNYGNYAVRDPRNDFQILIRQNFNEQSTKTGFKASSLNGARSTLQFRFFNNENLFSAGNEFRYMDIRSNFNRGDNVAEIMQGFEDNIWLVPQSNRAVKTYLESVDLNGRFVIETLDDRNPAVNSDYLHIHSGFKTDELASNRRLCILGAFNQFNCDEIGEMQYVPDFGGYETTFLLKQGMYDFQFGLVDEIGNVDFQPLEGNFSDTKNSYEIFIYHKPPTAKSELLVGYALIEK